MLDRTSPGPEFDEKAEAARADLAQALDQLRDRLKPAHMLSALGQGARNAAAPLLDPVLQQAKSSSGVIVLGVSVAALLFGLGRASVRKGEDVTAPAPNNPDIVEVRTAVAAVDVPTPVAPARAKPASGGGLVKTMVLSAAALAAGSVIAAQVPLTEPERRFAASTGRDVKDWARHMGQTHSGDMLGAAVNAFGFARGVGSLLALLALVGSPSQPGKARQ